MLVDKALIQSLHTSVLFKDIGSDEVEHIIAAGGWRIFEPGQCVYLQGENHRHFYIVVSGEVELTLNVEGGGQHLVSHIGPGGHFGETSLLTNNRNSLNARALTSVTLLGFDAEAFGSVLLANRVIQQQLSVALAKRLLVSFRDHVESLTKINNRNKHSTHNLDQTFFSEPPPLLTAVKLSVDSDREIRFAESTIARQINKAVQQFSNNLEPVLLSGESGTGRRMIAA
jgi:CRP-like cAMP-binding protein